MKEKKEKTDNHISEMHGSVTEQGYELGLVKIHENVVISLVREATCSIEGVVRLAGSSLVNNIAEFVGSKKIHDRAITVVMDGPSVEVNVKINIKYGSHIPTVAEEIQKEVTKVIEASTGMTVKFVNVIIQEITPLEEIEEEDDKTDSSNEDA